MLRLPSRIGWLADPLEPETRTTVMAKAYQVAAIPIRRSRSGSWEVLLITSRETRRWVVPKGWPWRDIEDHEAAAGEAWEEAGVRGTTNAQSIGTFTYEKRRKDKLHALKVLVYVLEVTEEATVWPEFKERQRSWFELPIAADLVAEPDLKALLLELASHPSPH
jgi:8-oxo-dGTP pyrophosphatase MutT (NUDIX family)